MRKIDKSKIRNTRYSILITRILSTKVERIRQIVPICQNKPNFPHFQTKNKAREKNKPNLKILFRQGKLLKSILISYRIKLKNDVKFRRKILCEGTKDLH